MTNLEHENQLLKKLVVDLAILYVDLFKRLPDDIRTHENCVRMLEISLRLIDTYGTTIQAPRDSQ